MSSYNDFASFYDSLTENVEYEVRSDYISNFFSSNGINDGIILDLACGTGSFTNIFANNGYDMIGVDSSEEMLMIANEKARKADNNILFLHQNMQELDLYGSVMGCICNLDSINHLNSIDDVKKTFEKVSLFTEPNGIFVFDVNTIYKHDYILADNSFVFETDDVYLVWNNELEDNHKVNIFIDMFVKNGELYRRSSEEFSEIAYDLDILKEMLLNAKFDIIGIYDELTLDKPKKDSERVYFVCKKQGD